MLPFTKNLSPFPLSIILTIPQVDILLFIFEYSSLNNGISI